MIVDVIKQENFCSGAIGFSGNMQMQISLNMQMQISWNMWFC